MTNDEIKAALLSTQYDDQIEPESIEIDTLSVFTPHGKVLSVSYKARCYHSPVAAIHKEYTVDVYSVISAAESRVHVTLSLTPKSK